MNCEHQKIRKITKHLAGLNKIDAYDLLQRIEVILFYANTPLNAKNLEYIINSGIDRNQNIDSFQFTTLPNGNFCEFIGSNNWIHIYKEQKRGLGRLPIFDTLYFKTKYAPLELTKLTNNNLLESLRGTAEEIEVIDFLKKHHVTQKNRVTSKPRLLDL